jgi:hypothetical protein
MKRFSPVAIGVAVALLAFAATAQKPASYPAKNQSATQQQKDDGECLAWAKQTTGVDPAAPAAPPPPAQPVAQGGRARGAAAGAAIGAIGGNDVGEAAVKGAVVGGVAQRNRARGQQQAAAAQAQQTNQQNMGAYYNAYGACMTGRGYTVK